MAQLVQPVEEPVDRLCLSGRVPVEGGQEVSLSQWPSLLDRGDSFSDGGLIEAQRSPAKH